MKNTRPILMCALLLLAPGCSKKETMKSDQGTVTMEKKGGTEIVEVKDKNGGGLKIATNEKGMALPEGFPKDVPIIPDAKVVAAMSTPELMTVNLQSPAPMAEGMKFYQEKLKAEGWNIEGVMDMEGVHMVNARKGAREFHVIFGQQGKLTTAQIMATPEGK